MSSISTRQCGLLLAALILCAGAPGAPTAAAAAKAAAAKAGAKASAKAEAPKTEKKSYWVKPPKYFEALFNGVDMNGWWGAKPNVNPINYMNLLPDDLKKYKAMGNGDFYRHWRVETGQLISDGRGCYATTDKWYGDFELQADFKIAPHADSGIFLRGCPQVQIWDPDDPKKVAKGAEKGSGGLFNNRSGAPGKDPLVRADNPPGEWNKLRIIMIKDHVWVWLNDRRVVKDAVMENYYDKTRQISVPKEGPIQLQTHGGEVRWRNLFIREIWPKEAGEWLKGKEPQ